MDKRPRKNIRFISGKEVKKAYSRNRVLNKIDINKEDLERDLEQETIEKLPKEVFSILGETLLFIDKVNKLEGEKDENK